MDIPNLFLIDQSFPDNNHVVIGIDNNIAVLTSDDMGCFTGDCFCCAEDGSDKPTVNLVFKYGKFEYSTTKSTSSFLTSEFNNDYPGPHIDYGYIVDQDNGDISGFANASRYGIRGSYQPLQYEKFILDATNSCGHEQITAYCFWPTCGGSYEIDCNTRKIKIIKNSGYIGTYGFDNEITEEYYDLGNVPSIRVSNNTGCGQPCLFEKEPDCLFNKNSLIYEFTDFKDYFYTKTELSEYQEYVFTSKSTGLFAFNRTNIFPLEISDCSNPNTISAIYPNSQTIVGSGKIENTTAIRYKNTFTGLWYPWEYGYRTYNLEYTIGHPGFPLGGNFIFSWARITSYETNDIIYGSVPDCESYLSDVGLSDGQNVPYRCGYFSLTAAWKYSDESDDQYYYCDPAGGRPNCKIPICDRILIGKPYFYNSYGEDIGKITAYYANL